MPTTKRTHKTTEHKQPEYTKLRRSSTDKIIAGVAGGLGEYFAFDPVIIRIVFVLLTVFGGSGILIYLILWLMIPSDNAHAHSQEDIMKENAEEMRTTVQEFSERHHNPVTANNARFVLAVILIVLGISFLSDNLGIMWMRIGRAWPIILIVLGAYMLINRRKRT